MNSDLSPDTSATVTSSPAKPSWLLPPWLMRLIDEASERSNPLLVRIVRQNLRNRSFLSVFFLMLAIGGVLSLVFAATPGAGDSDSDVGQHLFNGLLGVWGFSVIIVQSFMAYRSVINERQDDTWDLIELSALEPRHILRGLLLASLTQLIMFSAALAPYMMMAYMLRGIDIRILIFFFIFIPACGMSASIWSIFCACLTHKKTTQMLLALFALGGAVSLYIWVVILISSPREFLWVFRNLSRDWDTFLTIVGVFLNVFIIGNLMMLIFSAALLKHRAANRSTGPRAIWIGSYLNFIIFALIAFYCLVERSSSDFFLELCRMFSVFGVVGAYASFILGIFSVSEHYRLTPRQTRDLQVQQGRIKILRSICVLFLGPGAARGQIVYVAFSLFSLAVAGVGYVLLKNFNTSGTVSSYRYENLQQLFAHTWSVIAYGAITLVVTDFIYRYPLKRFFESPALRRSFILTFFALYNLLVALLIAYFNDFGLDQHAGTFLSSIFGIATITQYPNQFTTWQLVVAFFGAASLMYFLSKGVSHLNTQLLRTVADNNDRNPRAE